MRRLGIFVFLITALASRVDAQDPPPRIGPFVVDVHMSIPAFPTDSQQLAESHSLNPGELPGRGLGAQAGVHFYLPPWGALTLGLGGEVMIARATSTPADPSSGLRPAEERRVTASPQLSLNFGSGRGWSYLSGGIGRSVWSIHPVGDEPGEADVEPLLTVNYGGGARWFIKQHLAFSLDVRFYEIREGTPVPPAPASPRTTLFIIAAGISLK